MNNINPIFSVNNYYLPAFKQKQQTINVANPIDKNVQMNGLDALAGYNFNLVNKNNDFDIPTLSMVEIPENIANVDGEKIYNSNGELNCVIKDAGNYKIIYQNDQYKTIKIVDKSNNKIIQEQGCYVANTNEVRVVKDIDNSVGYFTDYDEREGKMVPVGKGKHIYYSDDSKKEFIHWLDSNTYQVIERSNVSKDAYSCDRVIDYDEQGNIKNITNYNI